VEKGEANFKFWGSFTQLWKSFGLQAASSDGPIWQEIFGDSELTHPETNKQSIVLFTSLLRLVFVWMRLTCQWVMLVVQSSAREKGCYCQWKIGA
jgi:hypothetical protein